MTNLDVMFTDIEQTLLSFGAYAVRRMTRGIPGHEVATRHWRAVLTYPGHQSVELVEGIKSTNGQLVALSSWMDLDVYQQLPDERVRVATNLQHVTPMTIVGILASPMFTQLGEYSAADNSCQHAVLRLLSQLGVPAPPSLVTLRLLLERAALEMMLGAVFIAGGAASALAL